MDRSIGSLPCATPRRDRNDWMSLVLAADYRISDFGPWWRSLTGDLPSVARLSARFVVVYRSIEDDNRIFVTMSIRERGPLDTVLRSPALFQWFDAAGVADIPPIFVGRVVDKLSFAAAPSHDLHHRAPVIVAGIVRLRDFDGFWSQLRADKERFARAGVLEYWAYRSLDDVDEVMLLQALSTEQQARRWIDYPEAAARWMQHAGVGVYPPPFVGRLVQVVDVSLVGR
jgi:hypothetical protein